MIARVANGAVTMAKARQPAFIVEVPRFVQRSGTKIPPRVTGSNHCEEFLPPDALVPTREKWKLAPAFKDDTALTLPGLTNQSNRQTRVNTHSSAFFDMISQHAKIDKTVWHDYKFMGMLQA